MSARSIQDIARELFDCASSWDPDVCLVGNVRAREVTLVAGYVLDPERRDVVRRANALPGLTATLDELRHVLVRVRAWLEHTADTCTISEHDYQELASILDDVPTPSNGGDT